MTYTFVFLLLTGAYTFFWFFPSIGYYQTTVAPEAVQNTTQTQVQTQVQTVQQVAQQPVVPICQPNDLPPSYDGVWES